MRSFGSRHVANTLEERKVASFIFQCVSGKVHFCELKITKSKEHNAMKNTAPQSGKVLVL